MWAFACCMAETLTGARVFVGATLPELVGKVLAGDADLTRLPAGLPRMVRSLLERSLRTEREDRPSLTDVVRALRDAAAPRVAAARPWLWRAAVTLAVALALAALLGRSLLPSRPAAPRGEPALRLAVGLEPIQAASGSAVPSGLLRDLDGALLRAVSDRKSLAVVSGQAAEVTVRGTVAHEALGLGVRLAVTDEHAGTVLGVVDLPIDAQAPAEAGKQVANAAASLLELEQVAREVGRGDALHGFLARRTRSVEAARGFRDGLRLLERTRYAEAKDALQRGLAADPAFWPAHLYLALDAKATSRFDEAHREVAEAQRLAPHPDEAEAVVIEETAATVAEDSQRRREALERARRFFPESAELTFGLAQVYRFQDRPAEAIPLLEKLLAMGWRPDWSPTREELAFCQLLAGRLKEVLATASAGEERFPTRYRYPFYAACALQQLGRTDQAREALRQAIRKHLDFTGTPPLAVHQLAAYWASLLRWEEECRSQWDAVLAETESGLLERPGSAALLQARAEALVGLGRYRDARNVLGPLAGAPGADPGVYLALCHALVGLGDAEGARKALTGAAAGWREGSVPALGTLAYNIAAGWAAAGDNARALDWLLRARDQYGVDRLDLAMDPDLDPLRRAGLLARLPPRR